MITNTQRNTYTKILSLSCYSFVIVLGTIGFAYVGKLIDDFLNTPPSFMIGLAFLAVICTIGRLYQDAWKNREK